MKTRGVVAASLIFFTPLVRAQEQPPDEVLAFDRPEAWAMKYFAAVGLMLSNRAPADLQSGGFAFGLEVSNIPHLSERQRTVGFNGTKEENLNKAPVLVRPLLHYAATDRLTLSAAYVPPVEVFDRLKTHLAGLAINYEAWKGDRWRIDLRAVGQWTWAQGDFTGPAEIAGVQDPTRNPLGVLEPSEDVFTSWTSTLEATLSWRLPTRLETEWFIASAATYADLDFEIDAILAGGFRDNRHQVTDGWLGSFATGFTATFSERLSGSAALVYVPLSVRRPPDFERSNDPLWNVRLTLNLSL